MLVDIKKEIKEALDKAVKDLTLPDENVSINLEHPKEESHGDYSTNVSMQAFQLQKTDIKGVYLHKHAAGAGSPLEMAEKIVNLLNTKYLIHNTDRIEAVKPGFINFWISKEYLCGKLQEINNKKEKYGEGENLKGKKIMVEFTDPNPFKEFHIGHLYSNTVGESVSRLLEAMGANLKRANYQGDVGMHVAKALYSVLKFNKKEFEELENKTLKEKVGFLGLKYADGADMYEKDDTARREIEELNKKIYVKDKAVLPYYEKGRQWSLEYFETVYKRLGTKFNFYYFESEVGINGLKLVKEYLAKGIFEESQGAVIFPGKKYNLHDRVFINSLGLPTYEAKELGLAFKKYSDFEFDQSIVITGNEIIGYFKVLIAALGKINPELAAKTKHLTHGMVRLPTGKMSSRSGNIITGEWLLDEAKKLLKSKFSEMSEEVLEEVAVGAVKYALLKSSLGHDIEFDFEESINIQGNSGPYLQYAYVRTQSVLSKVKNEISLARRDLARLEPEEVSLLRTLNKFPEIVALAAEKFAPNILCNYLFDLAQKFNLFYQKHKIIGSDQENFRLALTSGVGQVIKNGLNLLGIQAPKQM
jgi:arginyl-tRNA synthetase